LKKVAQRHPEALWPFWVQGHGRAWTVIGLDGSVSEGLVGWDAALGAKEWPFALSIWLRTEGGSIYAPEKCSPSQLKWSLADEYLPFPFVEYGDTDIRIQQRISAIPSTGVGKAEGIAQIQFKITSFLKKPIKGRIFLAVRPYLIHGRVSELNCIKWNSVHQAVEIEDHFMVWSDLGNPKEIIQHPVARLSLHKSPGDISLFSVLQKKLPSSEIVSDSILRMNAAAISWPLEIQPGGKVVTFQAPLGKGINQDSEFGRPQSVGLYEIVESWREKLVRARLLIPDSLMYRAYYASLAYILINADQGMPHPGPLAYDFFWCRD